MLKVDANGDDGMRPSPELVRLSRALAAARSSSPARRSSRTRPRLRARRDAAVRNLSAAVYSFTLAAQPESHSKAGRIPTGADAIWRVEKLAQAELLGWRM